MSKAYVAGDRIAGKYQLLELLGEGGMGAVWKAHNDTLDIDVALKLIRRDEGDGDTELLSDRLLQEARAAARLGHPAIARVFDFGISDRGNPFIVMELLRGEDLAQALARRGRISATKAVATLLPIAHALDAAHAQGIVHRDIKPENVFLARTQDDRIQPKLVDFGIAKVERNKSARLTQTGTMLGSPLYMSPEQARGDDVNHLADVWALSVVLYETVSGRTPFEGKNYNALLYAIIADEPPSLVDLGIGDEALWAIVRRGLDKDPTQRWQSMRELGAALARWLMDGGQREDITGASLEARWLRTATKSADMLASVMPPPDHQLGGRASDERTTEVQRPDAAAQHATLAGKVVSLPRAARKRRLVAIALLSASVGAALAVTALVRQQKATAVVEDPAGNRADVALGAASPEGEPGASHDSRLPTALSAEPGTTLAGDDPLAAASVAALAAPSASPGALVAAPGSSGESEVEPEGPTGAAGAAASGESAPSAQPAAKVRKRPKAGKATKKNQLKNPFD